MNNVFKYPNLTIKYHQSMFLIFSITRFWSCKTSSKIIKFTNMFQEKTKLDPEIALQKERQVESQNVVTSSNFVQLHGHFKINY